MVLNKLNISNFKMFDHFEVEFKSGFNLILGDNGVGKTTILEAATVAIAGFLAGMEDVAVRNIYKDDVRYTIVKDNNGTPNKLYDKQPTQIGCSLTYNAKDYEWVRTKKDATASTKTTIKPKDILSVGQELINSTENKLFPLISYQSASRHCSFSRNDSNEKKKKVLHDRRCGYLGCLDKIVNLQNIYDWCKQMEWNIVRNRRIPENYELFGKIISKFMSYMNDGVVSEVLFHPNIEKLIYVENGEFKEIENLSEGYQSVLSLVIDLAYRAAVLNPDAGEDIQNVEGIVLIDEIDSNLHPKWQWRIVDALIETFPNVQFIAATHSPIVVSSCKNANIISISDEQEIRYIEDSYAFSVNEILKDMLGHYMRPEKVENLVEEFEKKMDRDEYTGAKVALDQLAEILGEEHPKLIALQLEYELEAED